MVIGWGTSVKVAAIRINLTGGANGRVNGAPRTIYTSSAKHVDIVASFQTSYFISGIAPYGDSLVVLAYIPEVENGDKEFSSSIPSRQVSLHHFIICFFMYPQHALGNISMDVNLFLNRSDLHNQPALDVMWLGLMHVFSFSCWHPNSMLLYPCTFS